MSNDIKAETNDEISVFTKLWYTFAEIGSCGGGNNCLPDGMPDGYNNHPALIQEFKCAEGIRARVGFGTPRLTAKFNARYEIEAPDFRASVVSVGNNGVNSHKGPEGGIITYSKGTKEDLFKMQAYIA